MKRTLAVVVVALWVILTTARVADWQDPLHLWASALQIAPQKARVRINFANELTRRGFPGLAENELRRVADDPALITPLHTDAEENLQRLHVTEQDLQAWFRDDPIAIRLPSPR